MSMIKLLFIAILIALLLENYIVYAITDSHKIQQLKAFNFNSIPPPFLPNSRSCYCVPLATCAPLFNLLSSRPVHPEIIDYLRNKTCGFYGKDPYVCCFETGDSLAFKPPKVQQPRIERCMITTNEPNSLNEVETSSKVPTFEAKLPKVEDSTPKISNFAPRFSNNFENYPRAHFSPKSYDDYDSFPKNSNFPSRYPGFESPHMNPRFPFNPSKHPFPHRGFDSPHYFPFGRYPEESTENDITNQPIDSDEEKTTSIEYNYDNEEEEIDIPVVRSRILPDTTCGLAVDQRIISGKDVRIGRYPWMARIGYTRPKSAEYLYRCGGTLISSRYVITAAHCTTNLPGDLKLATVRLGELDERTDPDCESDECADTPQDLIPILITIHRNYDIPKYKNDISLLKLNKEAKITSYVNPICLPHNLMKSTNYSGMQAFAAGWGVVNIAARMSSPILQHVQLNITDMESCKSEYFTKFKIDIGEEQLCTIGINGQDACEGDSGGPLMKYQQYEGVPRYFLFGLVSFGPTQCGAAGLPSVFTKISYYLDWIIKHMDNESDL